MSGGLSIEQLLRWRLALGEAEAPPAPGAAFLLELARPWWETLPARLQAQVTRLRRIPLAYGYAMAGADHGRVGHPVPTLVARAEEVEASARVLYLAIRDGRMRLRFQLDDLEDLAEAPADLDAAFEATFVPEAPEWPLFSGHAALAQSGGYRVDVALPEELARRWAPLKVTDRMPFRLILRPALDTA